MLPRALLVAAGLLAVSAAPAFAGSVTAKVLSWDPASRTITLQDHSMFMDIAPAVAVPAGLMPGDKVTVNSVDLPEQDGAQAVTTVTLVAPNSLLSASAQGN